MGKENDKSTIDFHLAWHLVVLAPVPLSSIVLKFKWTSQQSRSQMNKNTFDWYILGFCITHLYNSF